MGNGLLIHAPVQRCALHAGYLRSESTPCAINPPRGARGAFIDDFHRVVGQFRVLQQLPLRQIRRILHAILSLPFFSFFRSFPQHPLSSFGLPVFHPRPPRILWDKNFRPGNQSAFWANSWVRIFWCRPKLKGLTQQLQPSPSPGSSSSLAPSALRTARLYSASGERSCARSRSRL